MGGAIDGRGHVEGLWESRSMGGWGYSMARLQCRVGLEGRGYGEGGATGEGMIVGWGYTRRGVAMRRAWL